MPDARTAHPTLCAAAKNLSCTPTSLNKSNKNKKLKKNFIESAAWLVAAVMLGACGPPPAYHHYRGEAMGTQVALTYAGCAGDVAAAVADELQQVDAQLSTWRSDSEVARFNASPTGDWFPVSAPVAALAFEALGPLAPHRWRI